MEPLGRRVMVGVAHVLEVRPNRGGSSLHVQATGELAASTQARRHARVHRRPNEIETFVDLRLGVHRELIAQSYFGNRQIVLIAQSNQRGCVGEGEWPVDTHTVGRFTVTSNETTADGKVSFFEHNLAPGIECRQRQCIRVTRKSGSRLKFDVIASKKNGVRTREIQRRLVV